MKHPYSLEKISRTGNIDANLNTRQYKLDLMARFVEIKAMNPQLKWNDLAKQLNHSSSTLQRYRNDLNMLSPYRIPSNRHKRRPKTSNEDLKRPQMNSKDI